jgi:hypothetical protein
MLSGCAVVEGVARYLVIAVGKHSEWGKIMTELDTERPDTPLQVPPSSQSLPWGPTLGPCGGRRSRHSE